jgi:tetratricopeptide (TPR) repeat protein
VANVLGDYDAGLRRLHLLSFALPRVDALAREASILLLAGRAAEAEPLLQQALAKLTPASTVPRVRLCSLLGHTYTALDRYDEAEHWLEEAMRIGDVTGNSQNGLAELRLEQGRAREALAIAHSAIEIAGRRANRNVSVVYYADLAWAQALLGRTDDARVSITGALAERKDTAAGQATVEWRVGRALLAMQATEEAYGHFRSGVDADPHGKNGTLCREELRKAGVESLVGYFESGSRSHGNSTQPACSAAPAEP